MSTYVGTVGQKISAEVKLINTYEYKDYKFSYYGTTHYIYTMQDSEGNVFVWKTTSFMSVDDGEWGYMIKKDDTILIKGTVKDHSEYNGTKQTVLNRCKYSLIEKAPVKPTKEEIEAKKREEQLQSIQEGDFIWEMPYKQWKEHYSDCETVAGSYECDRHGNKTIKVIIRKGRLKNSGVRGEHYTSFSFRLEDNTVVCYKAICYENAEKRIKKEYPNMKFELDKIYR